MDELCRALRSSRKHLKSRVAPLKKKGLVETIDGTIQPTEKGRKIILSAFGKN